MTTSTLPLSLPDSTGTPALGSGPQPPQSTRWLADAVDGARAGDQDAFAELYVKHKKHVFSLCIRMVRDFSLAEDLTQETFLQVHRKLASFRGDSLFSTWLHRLAINTVLMHMRKRVLASVSLDQMMENGSGDRAGFSFGTRDLPQAGVVDRLAIDHALAAMAPGYRSVFLLHDIQGFDHGEVASMLKCSCGNTKSQLYKARRSLRRRLAASTYPSTTGPVDEVKDTIRLQPLNAGPRRPSTRSRRARS
jgi:RNA polymerase sigma-70 factor (ECF subfamily)